MKKLLGIGIPVFLLAAGIIFFGFMQTGSELNDNVLTEKAKSSCCANEEHNTGEISENSIYQSETKWLDQDKKPVKLENFKGQPVVLTMFFASCTYACPMLVNDMKKIETALGDKSKEYRFLLVSIDPERDTPEKLKEFAVKNSFDLKRWTLLSGKEEDVMELAALIGFKYKKEPTGEYSHSNLITILKNNGEIAHQQVGLNVDPTATINEIKNL